MSNPTFAMASGEHANTDGATTRSTSLVASAGSVTSSVATALANTVWPATERDCGGSEPARSA